MSRVSMPQSQKKDDTGQMLQIGGAVLGGVAGGGAAGAMAGAQAGSMASNMLASNPSQVAPVGASSSGAMQRRMDALRAQQDQLRTLREADSALAALPPPQQQQYGPAIKHARYLAESEYA